MGARRAPMRSTSVKGCVVRRVREGCGGEDFEGVSAGFGGSVSDEEATQPPASACSICGGEKPTMM